MRLLALTLLPLLAGCIEEKTDDDDDGSAVDEDCDEHDATAHPGGTEVCNDGIRNDCDGSGRACSLDLGDAGDDGAATNAGRQPCGSPRVESSAKWVGTRRQDQPGGNAFSSA